MIEKVHITLNITGDFYTTSSYAGKDLADDVKAYFEKADTNIVNLECPVFNESTPKLIVKTGPNIYNREDIIELLERLKIDTVSLANNHIMDFGKEGLDSTLEFCQRNSINTVGAGTNLDIARKPLILEKDGLKVSVLNFAENEWASAKSDEHGANPFNLISNVKDIRAAKEQSDKVIVIFHGGHEYYPLPSPMMQESLRFFAEEGADLIVCHHTHIISGYEVYHGVPIFYGLGNFLFTLESPKESWYSGLILNLSIDSSDINWEILPVCQNKESFKLAFMNDSEKAKTLEEIESLNRVITDTKALEVSWQAFVKSKSWYYKQVLSPEHAINHKGVIKYLPYISAAAKKLTGKYMLDHQRYYRHLLNHLRCESHRELSIEVLERIVKK